MRKKATVALRLEPPDENFCCEEETDRASERKYITGLDWTVYENKSTSTYRNLNFSILSTSSIQVSCNFRNLNDQVCLYIFSPGIELIAAQPRSIQLPVYFTDD